MKLPFIDWFVIYRCPFREIWMYWNQFNLNNKKIEILLIFHIKEQYLEHMSFVICYSSAVRQFIQFLTNIIKIENLLVGNFHLSLPSIDYAIVISEFFCILKPIFYNNIHVWWCLRLENTSFILFLPDLWKGMLKIVDLQL